jgi:hypothetical protein
VTHSFSLSAGFFNGFMVRNKKFLTTT